MYYQPQQQLQRPGPSLKGRPVASLDEARVSAIDFDGSIFFFPDLANKRIYTKQVNMDGTVTLLMYELKEIPIEEREISKGDYITREEFNAFVEKLTKQQSRREENKNAYEF